ncbi:MULTISPECIES: DUF2523 family protein [Marinobacter]|uniref:DUF2523 family protein n=1 Tax=Marinobacter TaxID=2742 RepID=UPI001267D07D|nr:MULTISPECIES: DUF2523 family protein [Marinobacter]QFS86022.1 hypothetical protein FIV08_04150 [Marinobacter sp. THAF197a]
MPILYFVWSIVLSVVPYIVTYVVRGLGFGLIVFTGVTLILDQAEQFLFAKFDGLPTALYSVLAIAGFPLGIKILFTAFGICIAIKTAVKPAHPIWRKPGSPWEA